MTRLLAVLAFAGGLTACNACEPSHGTTHAASALDPDAPLPGEASLEDTRDARGAGDTPREHGEARLDFLERTTGGARADERLPMIVALHGLGDRPEHWLARWDTFPVRARIILPRAPTPWHDGGSWFPYPPASMESLATSVDAAANQVAELLAALCRERPTRGKPIVTGFSQGGFLTFALATRHADVVSAAFPMSGALPPSLIPQKAPEGAPPIFAVHGTADDVVPIAPTREAVARLRAVGFRAELAEYVGVLHTVSPRMREDVDVRMIDSAERAAALP